MYGVTVLLLYYADVQDQVPNLNNYYLLVVMQSEEFIKNNSYYSISLKSQTPFKTKTYYFISEVELN